MSAGLGQELCGVWKFSKLSTIVCFSFFPAPTGKATMIQPRKALILIVFHKTTSSVSALHGQILPCIAHCRSLACSRPRP